MPERETLPPPLAPVIDWKRIKTDTDYKRFVCPDALFIVEHRFAFSNDRISRALNYLIPLGSANRFNHPGFMVFNTCPVNDSDFTGKRYETWKTWPDNRPLNRDTYYYPTRLLVVRVDPDITDEKGRPIATVLLESCPGKKHATCSLLFRAACVANALKERLTGLPIIADIPEDERPTSDIPFFELAGRTGLVRLDQKNAKITRIQYLNGKPTDNQ